MVPLSLYSHTFPHVTCATQEGIVAYGGDLNINRILKGYSCGIFPWFKENDPILWWSPDPRYVIDLSKIKISKRLRAVYNKSEYTFELNKNFKEVIENCSKIQRVDQEGSWITQSMIEAYIQLHHKGDAISFEAYKKDKLIGGGYGVILGDIFYGESMFSLEDNASKCAFIYLVEKLIDSDFSYVDCKVFSETFQRFGAQYFSREEFLKIVKESLSKPRNIQSYFK